MGNLYVCARKWGASILHRYVTPDGNDVFRRERFRPVLYMPDNTGRGDLDHRAMEDSKPLGAVEYDNAKDMRDAVRSYAGSGVLYGQDNVELQFLSRTYVEPIDPDMRRLRIGTIDIEVRSAEGFPDPKDANQPITAITLHDSIDGVYRVYTLAEWSAERSELDSAVVAKVQHRRFTNETDLLRAFVLDWRAKPPAILTGWYVESFDAPYIVARIAKVLGDASRDMLSPFGEVRIDPYFDKFKNEKVRADMVGVVVLDLLELYRKFTYKMRALYKLDYIAHVEVGAKKIDYSAEGTLHALERDNPQRFVDYNITDVTLVLQIEEKRQLIALAVYIAYTAKVGLRDVFSPIRTWDAIIFNHLIKDGVVPRVMPRQHKTEKFKGAYVKEPGPGFYEALVSIDAASLYPTTIEQWNMCMSTVVDVGVPYSRDYEEEMMRTREIPAAFAHVDLTRYAIAANGVAFDKTKKGVFPTLIARFKADRAEAKKRYKDLKGEMERLKETHGQSPPEDVRQRIALLDIQATGESTRQVAIKTVNNSFYGQLGSPFCRYYDIRIAEAVTLNGRLIIQWVERAVNEFLAKAIGRPGADFCIAIDTDSNLYTLKDIVLAAGGQELLGNKARLIDFMDKTCQILEEKVIAPALSDLADKLGCPRKLLEMKRESLADMAFWVAKKHYAMNVYDQEGVRYAEPEVKAVGLELVQAKTPDWCRTRLEEVVKVLLRGRERDRIARMIEDVRSEFNGLSVEDSCLSYTISDVDKFTSEEGRPIKGTPQNAKGAIAYNRLLVRAGLTGKFERIRNGDKVKILHLRQPNPAHSEVVCFPVRLPPEMGLHPYVDRDRLFEAAFLGPVRNACEALDLPVDSCASVEGFFS